MTMRLDAVGVRGGATKIGSAGEDLKQVFDTLKSAIDAEGECWGHDETGQEFAKNYVPGKDGVVDALGKLSEALGNIMTNLKQTADDIEGRDQQAGSDFGKIRPPSA